MHLFSTSFFSFASVLTLAKALEILIANINHCLFVI